MRAQISQKTHIFASTDMILECKKSNKHAWIFFTRPKRERLEFGHDQTTDRDIRSSIGAGGGIRAPVYQ